MDGNCRTQVKMLQQKARIYSEQLRTGVINHQHAWYSYEAAFSKTLEYPMEACCISLTQWESIIKIYLSQLLNKAGLVHSMPRDLVFSDTRYSGLGLKHPYYLQYIKHIILLATCNQLDQQTKNLLHAAWEEIVWESGTGNWPLREQKELLEITTDSWMKHTLLFMKEHDMEFTLSNWDWKTFSCDRLIMPTLRTLTNDKETLRKLNEC